MSKIAFIGAGRMASAMVEGLLAKNIVPAADISCHTASGKSAQLLAAKAGITYSDNLSALLRHTDVLVLAYKPQHLPAKDDQLAELTAGKIVVSVLAAKTLSRLSQVFPTASLIVRTMPNTPSSIGAGVTGWCTSRPPTDAERQTINTLLGAMGKAVEIPESQMDALMGVSGCGPAFVFEFCAALRDAGVAAGLDAETAQMLSIETLLGASRLMARTGTQPEELRNQVTSPNGTTFAGLQRMEARDFRGMIKETVLAAKSRAEELSKG